MRPNPLSPALLEITRNWQAALRPGAEAAQNPSGSDFLKQVRAAGAIYGDQPVCVVRQPMVLDDALVAVYRRVLAGLHAAVRVARHLLIEDGLDGRPESLAVRIGVEQASLALARIEPGYESAAVLARADSYLLGRADGSVCPLFLELNAESPAGMAYNDALSTLLLDDPLIHSLNLPLRSFGVTGTVVRALLTTWRMWAGHSRAPSVAIVDLAGVPTAPEFALFRQAFEAQGVRCLVATAQDLEFDGDHLWAGSQVIDLVYRRLLVADVHAHPKACAALVAACRAGAVCLVNSFRTSLLHSKGLFALLHKPLLRRHLPTAVSEILDACVPWTGLLTPGDPAVTEPLRERALRAPEDWVLKPLSGHGGQGVLLGWQADRASWSRAVSQAQAHVLQRRAMPWRAIFPDARHEYSLRERMISLDPFLVCGELAGFLCRLSEGDLANVTAGSASQIPVLALAPAGHTAMPGPQSN